MAETTENEYYTDEEEDLVGDEEEGGQGSEGEEEDLEVKERKRPLKDGFSKRGVIYLSRVPPKDRKSVV